MHNEILSTVLVFLSSANREIVKSALGYVKLAIHTLSIEILRQHLSEIISALLNWSHDHKNHFKVKVRHIFERLLRRFDFDEVYNCASDQEAAKVLLNIKKRKDRAKRKRAAKEEEDEDEPVSVFLLAFLALFLIFSRMPPLPNPRQEMLSRMFCMAVRANWETRTTKRWPHLKPRAPRANEGTSRTFACGLMVMTQQISCMVFPQR